MKVRRGNSNRVYITLGASNHTDQIREKDDYYATTPKAAELLLDIEEFSPYIWECACGEGHLSKVFESFGYNVKSTDLIDRGYGETNIDFFTVNDTWKGDIITNPPYKFGQQFIEKALDIINNGNKVAMFLKLQFMEGKNRKKLFIKNPPKTIYVSSSRLMCAKNGEFEKMIDNGGSAIAYGCYVWEKGYSGNTQIKWIN